jgi:cysteine desulfurase
MTMRPIYMDNHSTTRADPRVVEAMLPYFTEKYGNAASVDHVFGSEAANAVDKARTHVAELLQVDPRDLIFTSGATEANNLAIKGVMQAAGPGSHLVTAAAEHRAVLDPARKLARNGFEVTIVDVDRNGMVTPQNIADAIQPDTVLVSVMFANNEVGTINPIEEIGHICSQRNVLLHTDAVQAVGKISLNLSQLPVDLASLTAHKFHGPKGVGALFVRRGEPRIRIEPLIDGGGHERRLRSGTLPVPLIVAMGEACRLSSADQKGESQAVAALRDRLWNGLSDSLTGLHLNGHPEDRLPGNLNISFEHVDGDALMAALSGLAVSSGSACTSADPKPSHVLRAMGVSEVLTRASLRFGLSRFNTAEEVEVAINIVTEAVTRLRQTA